MKCGSISKWSVPRSLWASSRAQHLSFSLASFCPFPCCLSFMKGGACSPAAFLSWCSASLSEWKELTLKWRVWNCANYKHKEEPTWMLKCFPQIIVKATKSVKCKMSFKKIVFFFFFQVRSSLSNLCVSATPDGAGIWVREFFGSQWKRETSVNL